MSQREREREREGERERARERHGYFNNIMHLLLDGRNTVYILYIMQTCVPLMTGSTYRSSVNVLVCVLRHTVVHT